MKNKYLVVSIHDVTPNFNSQLTKIISELDKIGVNKKSILVIPDYLGKNSISQSGEFIEWLHSLQDKGNEIVQHGLEHISTNHNYPSFLEKFIGEQIAQGCGEFQNISYKEAKEKIWKGKEIFKANGFGAVGFVAPAWLLNPESEKALKEDFQYTTSFSNIEFFSPYKKESSNIVVFTSGGGLINKGFEWYNQHLIKRKFKNQRIARVAIHPQDIESGFFQLTLNAINELRQNKEIVTYADILDIKNE